MNRQENTDLYQRLFESANVPILIIDADFRFIECNEIASRLIDIPQKELIGCTPIEISPTYQKNGELSAELGKKYFESAMQGNDLRFEWIHLKKDGTELIVEVSLFGFYASHKQNFFVMWRDLTEIRLKELELTESEERFRTIFYNATDGMILHSPVLEVGITHCNEAAYKILGYESADGIIGKTVFDISPEFQTNGIKSFDIGNVHIEECLQNGQIRFEWIHLKKDNSEVWMDIVLTKISFLGKVYIHSVWRDITDKKVAETKLKEFNKELIKAKEKAVESEKKIINYQEIAKLGGWELDVATGIFTFNDSFYKIYHTSAEKMGGYEMTAKDYIEKLVHPDEVSIVTEHMDKMITTDDQNYSNYVEHRILYMDGGIGYIGVRYFIIKDKNGKTIKAFGVDQDITERKNSEIELIKAKEKAEESDRLKTAFLVSVSHEIRTPMAGILNFISILEDPEFDEVQRSEFRASIKRSGLRMINTINDLVEISQIEIGDIYINYENINLVQHMDYYYDLFKTEAEEKGLELRITKQMKGDSANIKMDKHKLDGIIINLIKNAIKFTEKGNIEIGNYLENENLWFYVSDTGIGIPEDKLESVFDRFVQVELGTTRNFDGLGIGLSIAKAYIDVLKGSIEVESEVGKGSTFRFCIPHIPLTK